MPATEDKPSTLLMRDVERRFNYPIRPLLIRLLNDLKTVRAVAEEIGVSHQTAINWFELLDIPVPPRGGRKRTP